MGIGSSPRLWGTHPRNPAIKDRVRFIPTPVGNTSALADTPDRLAVHPHACGEHLYAPCCIMSRDGSSPRLWGTHLYHVRRVKKIRFIPTPVGNTPVPYSYKEKTAVHPHACGEHVCPLHLNIPILRFIPTPVGNTSIL